MLRSKVRSGIASNLIGLVHTGNNGHVHTGNLDIIEHPGLRKIMQKGARFIEIPNISHKNYIFQLCKSIDKMV